MSLRVLFYGLCIGWVCLLPILVLQGCHGNGAAPSVTGTSAEDSSEKADSENSGHKSVRIQPLLQGWEQPAVAIVLSGEQHGYLEPCGCSETQSGGFSRRADLFRQLSEKGWSTTALDVGGSLSSEHSRRQDAIKFGTILDGLKEMHYAGLALGREELRLGAEVLLSLQSEALPFLDANVVFFGSPELGTPLAGKIVEVNQVKLGVAAMFGPSYRDDVLPKSADGAEPQDAAAPIAIGDPAEALGKVLGELRSQEPQLLILLSHARPEESRQLAEKFPDFDVILTAGGSEEPDEKPVQVGKTLVISVGGKGKHVGVLGFYPQNPAERLRYEFVDLDKHRFQNTPKMDEFMRIYQDRLRDEQIAEREKPIAHPSGASFTGAAKCGECHTKAFSKWKTTKHSQAFESLKKGREGQEATWISRVFDAECLACHVAGWNAKEILPYVSGYVSESQSPLLLGQQCENCHGPGSQHVEVEELWKKKRGDLSDELIAQRKAMHLDQKVAKDRVCYECHDSDNSPKFNFEEYWKKVEHRFRD